MPQASPCKIETFDFLLTSLELATSLSFLINKIIFLKQNYLNFLN